MHVCCLVLVVVLADTGIVVADGGVFVVVVAPVGVGGIAVAVIVWIIAAGAVFDQNGEFYSFL